MKNRKRLKWNVIIVMICTLVVGLLLTGCMRIKKVEEMKMTTLAEQRENTDAGFTQGEYDDKSLEVLEEIRPLVVENLSASGVEGNIERELELIPVKSSLANGYALARVKLDYAWLDGMLVYKAVEGEKPSLKAIIPGMSFIGLYLADLDADGQAELIYLSEFGSGMRYVSIGCYNFERDEMSNITYYNDNKGIALKPAGEKLDVFSYYDDLKKISEEPIGYLKLMDGNLELITK